MKYDCKLPERPILVYQKSLTFWFFLVQGYYRLIRRISLLPKDLNSYEKKKSHQIHRK